MVTRPAPEPAAPVPGGLPLRGARRTVPRTPLTPLLSHLSSKEHAMCRATTCNTCGKTTWAGCGQHVDQVMKNVSRQDRCPGHAKGESRGGFFARHLGR